MFFFEIFYQRFTTIGIIGLKHYFNIIHGKRKSKVDTETGADTGFKWGGGQDF